MNIFSALMIRYEEMGETQWFLTPTTCDKDCEQCTEGILSHVVGVRNHCVSPISSYLIISALIMLINPNLFIVSLIF